MINVTPTSHLNLRATGKERKLQALSCLLSIMRGELVLGRGIGVNPDIVDKNINRVGEEFRRDIYEQVEKYLPCFIINKITFKSEPEEGKLIPNVEVEFADE